jgi:hypothetical protein
MNTVRLGIRSSLGPTCGCIVTWQVYIVAPLGPKHIGEISYISRLTKLFVFLNIAVIEKSIQGETHKPLVCFYSHLETYHILLSSITTIIFTTLEYKVRE